MSDVSGGPGWWLASDGKWYPPESWAQPAPAPASLSAPAIPVPGQSSVTFPPPGWYLDPSGLPASRYWDGSQWTQTVGSSPHQGAAPRPRQAFNGWLIALIVVGSVLTVLAVAGLFGSTSTQVDGVVFNCGSVVRAASHVDACTMERRNVLIGLVVFAVVGAGMLATGVSVGLSRRHHTQRLAQQP
jgi:hypothetical protein